MLLNCLIAQYTSSLHKDAKTNLRAKKAIVNNLSKLRDRLRSAWGGNTSDSERGGGQTVKLLSIRSALVKLKLPLAQSIF